MSSSLRFKKDARLKAKKSQEKKNCSRSFGVPAPKIWMNRPPSPMALKLEEQFQKQFKTFLFGNTKVTYLLGLRITCLLIVVIFFYHYLCQCSSCPCIHFVMIKIFYQKISILYVFKVPYNFGLNIPGKKL